MPLPVDAHTYAHARDVSEQTLERISLGVKHLTENTSVSFPPAGGEAQTQEICEVGAGGASRRQAPPRAAAPGPPLPLLAGGL